MDSELEWEGNVTSHLAMTTKGDVGESPITVDNNVTGMPLVQEQSQAGEGPVDTIGMVPKVPSTGGKGSAGTGSAPTIEVPGGEGSSQLFLSSQVRRRRWRCWRLAVRARRSLHL